MEYTMHMDKLRTMARNCSKDEQRIILDEIDGDLIVENLQKRLSRLNTLESAVMGLAENLK